MARVNVLAALFRRGGGVLAALAVSLARVGAADTLWTFHDPSDRLAAVNGNGVLQYFDPDNTGWGATQTQFGSASSFGLPAMLGGDPAVMCFPACSPRQGYRVVHGGTPNGPYGETGTRVSNYTLIMDILWPSASDGRWRALIQTDTNNTSDAEFYVQNTSGGGIGTIGVYNGSLLSNKWHRVAIVMQSAPGEGKCARFIDGRFVGGIGSTGSGLDVRWALTEAFLLFADNDGETAQGYVSSIYFVDRAMRFEEIQALGGPHALGAATPGNPAPPLAHQMPRRVGTIGHRGGFFCCAPDNTMAAVRRAISNDVPVIEIDTRLSADGVCVLVHDATVDRTTDGTGAVLSMTVAQLKTLDAGASFSPEFAGERIPTAAEVMAEAKGKMILYFDLKVPGQIDAITNALAQTGFSPDDCWFWVYNNSSDAAQIRSRLPNAKIIWEAPGTWAGNPNFFNTMRSIGVYGFDQGVYYGTISSTFVRAAKEQGFMVSIYTILDPDTMVRNAALGVDYMETDFPQVMQQMQPPQLARASGPLPAQMSVNVATNPLLGWVVGSNAVTHRVYLGSNANPSFLREQAQDIVSLSNLAAGATYHWRIDEVTSSGVVTGEVWSFTTGAGGSSSALYQWDFEDGTLAPSIGNGILAFADGVSQTTTQFGTTDGAAVPHINGQPAHYMRVPAFTGLGNGYDVFFTDSGPNGGGSYINQYTMIFDVLVPGPLNWTALFNSNPENANDADFYIGADGTIGIATLGYSPAGAVVANTWARVAFVADLGPGQVRMYVNGALVRSYSGGTLIDGRFSLYSNADPGADLLLFNEGDSSGVYTHEVLLSSYFFTDRAMTGAEIASLGEPRAAGVFTPPGPRLTAMRSGQTFTLSWAGAAEWRLQHTTSLFPADWQDVPDTAGASSYSEPIGGPGGYFRLIKD